ncbi:unnamed protein product [Owenia fusiformis]|uniref:Uncharacterized protein n=1 Tax=Owenia fusiformis TaxID=6347 RepID=A0A8J1TAI0_OWEFU|nr:unnamed protein product [Owenia fusiformis]
MDRPRSQSAKQAGVKRSDLLLDRSRPRSQSANQPGVDTCDSPDRERSHSESLKQPGDDRNLPADDHSRMASTGQHIKLSRNEYRKSAPKLGFSRRIKVYDHGAQSDTGDLGYHSNHPNDLDSVYEQYNTMSFDDGQLDSLAQANIDASRSYDVDRKKKIPDGVKPKVKRSPDNTKQKEISRKSPKPRRVLPQIPPQPHHSAPELQEQHPDASQDKDGSTELQVESPRGSDVQKENNVHDGALEHRQAWLASHQQSGSGFSSPRSSSSPIHPLHSSHSASSLYGADGDVSSQGTDMDSISEVKPFVLAKRQIPDDEASISSTDSPIVRRKHGMSGFNPHKKYPDRYSEAALSGNVCHQRQNPETTLIGNMDPPVVGHNSSQASFFAQDSDQVVLGQVKRNATKLSRKESNCTLYSSSDNESLSPLAGTVYFGPPPAKVSKSKAHPGRAAQIKTKSSSEKGKSNQDEDVYQSKVHQGKAIQKKAMLSQEKGGPKKDDEIHHSKAHQERPIQKKAIQGQEKGRPKKDEEMHLSKSHEGRAVKNKAKPTQEQNRERPEEEVEIYPWGDGKAQNKNATSEGAKSMTDTRNTTGERGKKRLKDIVAQDNFKELIGRHLYGRTYSQSEMEHMSKSGRKLGQLA